MQYFSQTTKKSGNVMRTGEAQSFHTHPFRRPGNWIADEAGGKNGWWQNAVWKPFQILLSTNYHRTSNWYTVCQKQIYQSRNPASTFEPLVYRIFALWCQSVIRIAEIIQGKCSAYSKLPDKVANDLSILPKIDGVDWMVNCESTR